jgi:hypothetical protein
VYGLYDPPICGIYEPPVYASPYDPPVYGGSPYDPPVYGVEDDHDVFELNFIESAKTEKLEKDVFEKPEVIYEKREESFA